MTEAESQAFTVAFAHEHPFGRLVGVHLPSRPLQQHDAVAQLAPSERLVADTLKGFRYIEWVGGRLAAGVAALHFGASPWALLRGQRGEPVPPNGFSASISHKRSLAVALVSNVEGEEIGVDVENDVSAAKAIEDVVFSRGERAGFDALPADEQGAGRMVAFSLKEATYKALSGRYELGYADASVTVYARTRASVELHVAAEPLEAAIVWYGSFVIAAVRGERRSRPRSPSSSAR